MPQQASTLVEAANRLAVCEQPDSEALRYLILVCKWFDERIDDLPRVIVLHVGVRRIEVFENIAWIVDENNRTLDYGTLASGRFRSYSIWFSVLSPLAMTPPSLWLRDIMEHLGITRKGLSAESMGEEAYSEAIRRYRWVLDTAYDLLLNDPNFIRLSEVLLPAALDLPKEVVAIALGARQADLDELYLDCRTFKRAWCHLEDFRAVARDAPNMLQLFYLLCNPALKEPEFASPDPLLSIKRYLKSNGLTEATWRYVVRHSPNLFRGFWNEFTNIHQQRGQTIGFLLCLQDAKLPPPPTDDVVSLLGKYHWDNFGQSIPLLHRIQPMIVRAAIIEGNRRAQAAQLESFAQELQDVFWWSGTLTRPLDKNQRKAGWSWLLRQTRTYLRMEDQIASAARKEWAARLPATEIDGYEIFPLDSAEKLVRAGFSMRNCLTNCVKNSAIGKAEYYAMRKIRSGKVEYCIEFKFDEDGAMLSAVNGFANSSAPQDARQVAEQLLIRLREA